MRKHVYFIRVCSVTWLICYEPNSCARWQINKEHWCCKQKTNALVDHCSSVYFLTKWIFWINMSSGNINNNIDVLWCPLNDKQRSWEGRPDHDTSLENGLQFVFYPAGISLTNLNTVNLQTLFQHVCGGGARGVGGGLETEWNKNMHIKLTKHRWPNENVKKHYKI